MLSSPDRAPGRDPTARGTECLPARAGGQGRGRDRPAADLVRPACTRPPRPRPPRRRKCPAGRGPDRSRRSSTGRGASESEHGEGRGGVTVHRSSDPGHWIVTFPWTGAERAHTIAEAALSLAERDVSPVRRARLTGAQERLLARWQARISEARATPPTWIRDAARKIPVVSITGTNGKSTVTRLITHILVKAGRRVGTTTSDGVLVNERLVEAGDWTGPGGALQILDRSDLDVAVLETARGGLVLRGMGYESNEVSVVTNVTSDHLDLQGIHTLPELAEVKSTVARVTKPDGWTVLNADDRFVAGMARRVRSHVAHVLARFRRLGRGQAERGGGWTRVCRPRWLARRACAQGRDAGRRGRPDPDHDRRNRPPQRRERTRRGRGGAGPRGVGRGGRRRPRRVPADLGLVTGTAEPLPARRPDRHRRLRPQRGRRRRGPRRR